MGKRRGGKKRVLGGIVNTLLTLREEACGKSRPKDVKLILKLKHLQCLAEWFAGEASIPSLGAFFGHRFAEFGESLGFPPDHSLFPCRRCETLLQPSHNCNVKIEKNRSKMRRCVSKTKPPPQHNTVYTCNFCSHRNMKPGAPKGYAKQLPPANAKPISGDSTTTQERPGSKRSDTNKLESSSTSVSNVATTLGTTDVKLLDSKRRKRKKLGSKELTGEPRVSSAPAEAGMASGASRKRRKCWTSLKEMAANEEHERNKRFKSIAVPFSL